MAPTPLSPVETRPAPDAAARDTRAGPTVLEARDVMKRYPLASGPVDAVRGVSLQVHAGEFVALMGPSGSGKTTLLQVLGGLDRPTSGEVVLEGERISHLDDDAATRLRRDRTGFVFQSFNLIPLLDVVENVGLPFTIAGDDVRKGEPAERIRDAIALVDLTGKEAQKPHELSAGEQQRVAIARALVTRPAILLADEPTGNLDEETADTVFAEFLGLVRGEGSAALVATHNERLARRMDRVLRLHEGVLE